jgi:hypothetical protein
VNAFRGGLSFRVAGAGADIWGAADAFQYVFETTASATAIIQVRRRSFAGGVRLAPLS